VKYRLLFITLFYATLVNGQMAREQDSLIGKPNNIEDLFYYTKTMDLPLDVVQIGDSHIQPGVMAAPLGKILKNTFGNGGYGMAYPYQLANTNGHSAYKTSSNVSWKPSKVTSKKPNQPIGISGYSLYQNSPDAYIDYTFDSLQTPPIHFVTIFHSSNLDSNYHYAVESKKGIQSEFLANESTPFKSVFYFEKAVSKFRITHIRKYKQQTTSVIQGVYVRSKKSGAVVSSIGVNGATFNQYNHAEDFRKHIESLAPDIVILSLGTNEAFAGSYFSDSTFREEVRGMIQLLSGLEKPPIIVLTTPPGVSISEKVGKKYVFLPNPLVPRIRKVQIELCQTYNLYVYDLFTCMGGAGSMLEWSKLGLTDAKHIHLSMKGYTLAGESMSKAFTHHLRHIQKHD
jgi:lysophospholipase L1-like esterase